MKPEVSVVVVSFNTCDLLRDCLRDLYGQLGSISAEVFVVDNASSDGSAAMVSEEFPQVHLIASRINLGFAAANNLAIARTSAPYIVLLNSDAFVKPGALDRILEHMDKNSSVALGGARLVGPNNSWQPSGRLFPSPLNDFLALSGLSARFARSRFFGRFDRTWASCDEAADVDWVPGAFSIIRRSVLETVGVFDERFFLYYEEVDLCRRIKAAGYRIRYWPDVVVVHIGGESSKTMTNLEFSSSGAQLALWRIRSAFLYYRKHHGVLVWFAKEVERVWHWFRAQVNLVRQSTVGAAKARESKILIRLLEQAWRDTSKGAVSPSKPW